MNRMLRRVGGLAGWGGLALLLVATALRFGGYFHFAGFQITTLLQGAIALLGAGCFILLWELSARDSH